MPRKLKNTSACKFSDAPRKLWCSACRNRLGVNQCVGLQHTVIEPPAASPNTARVQPPYHCRQCSKPCYIEVCSGCMQLTPPPPPPPTPTPTSIRTRCGRVVKSRHIWSYPSNQVRDQRIDREFAVGWRGINAQFPRESPAPPMSTPVPPLPTHARAHMTIDEIFETQRLRDKLRKASDEAHAAELTAFMNTNIVPIIRELNDTRARCSALEQHLKRARTSLAGHVVSARPGVARVIPEALEGRGFQSDRSYQRHLATLEGHVRATYPDDEIKQAQLARGLAARMLADTDIAKDQKTKLATDAIISGLQTFYSTLRAKYHTKLPNDASIAQRTIDQAAMAESFDVPASWIAEVLRTDQQLSGCVLDLRSVSQFLRMMPG